jgi:hypothetical protein
MHIIAIISANNQMIETSEDNDRRLNSNEPTKLVKD